MEEFIAAALELHTTKQKEHTMFATALGEAKEKNGGESKAEITKYKALKKRSLGEGAGGEQPQAVVQVLQDANAALYEKLMDLEMGAAERCVETTSASYTYCTYRTYQTTLHRYRRYVETIGVYTSTHYLPRIRYLYLL